ncbi:MAG TPA: alpha/beta fold hydrolase [Tepidisphaeraceae bacterium]|jgi:cephalosporin-C deacetylase|nr:alpha/beta fold hydrolase [Tepidisphaeraceae bacterium]
MPLVDMPMAQLVEYQGRNPKPADFEAYWDSSLAEMHAIDPAVELKPAPFEAPGVECKDLYFTGVGGARVHAKYLRPKKIAEGKKIPAVCLFHGYSGHAGDWVDKLNYVSAGFAVAAMDCRGQAGSSEDITPIVGNTHHGHIIRGLSDPNPKKLLFRSIFLDTAQLARIIMGLPDIDATRVGAAGGSQGGALTLACAALEPKIKRAAATYPFLCDYQRVWEMDLTVNAYSELRTYFRHFDPTHARDKEIFTKLGYIDCQHLAGRIRGEILMGVGLMDAVCPPSTQFAAYNKITAKKSTVVYPDFGHEGLPGFNDKVFEFMMGL